MRERERNITELTSFVLFCVNGTYDQKIYYHGDMKVELQVQTTKKKGRAPNFAVFIRDYGVI